jgi:hypothetical protein
LYDVVLFSATFSSEVMAEVHPIFGSPTRYMTSHVDLAHVRWNRSDEKQ